MFFSQIIAEIGINHNGNFETAKEMIQVAANYCKVDVVKFQKRDIDSLSKIEEYQKPHPNPQNAFGETYFEHKKALEFSIDQHRQLKEICEQNKVIYSCSVWDSQSTKDIVSLNPEFIKIPSACNLNFEIYDYLLNNYNKKIHVSLGMTTSDEKKSIISFFKEKNYSDRLVLYHCTSSYPTKFEDINLFELMNLRNEWTNNNIDSYGFSGHHLGISVDIAAMILGAAYIERHFTLDRSMKGSDHSSSLEPDQLRRLVRDKDNVSKSLTFKNKEILDCEVASKNKLKR